MIHIKGKNYITVKTAADRLQMTEQTIRAWIRKGKLSAVKLGKPLFINEEEINNLFTHY